MIKIIIPYIYLFSGIIFLSTCHIDKWDLPDKSNESIPSYASIISQFSCVSSFNTRIFSEDDSHFVTCIESSNGLIQVIRIEQQFNNEKWTLTSSLILEIPGHKLYGFEKYDDKYFILYQSLQGKNKIVTIEKLAIKNEFYQFQEFIDTFYNKVSATNFKLISVQSNTKELLLSGEVNSQGSSFSSVMAFDFSLKPKWFKTYLKNAEVLDFTTIDNDSFLLIQKYDNELNIILDDHHSQNYKKFRLDIVSPISEMEIYNNKTNIYLLNSRTNNSIASVQTIQLNNKRATIHDIKAYPVKQITGLYYQEQIICTGIVDSIGKSPMAFCYKFKKVIFQIGVTPLTI
ncbi:MAG: hypothetical protein IPH96_16285 [Saprospiraceae bacterium]|nr:hypothetical protein [Saprospiraceae bacterium]